MFQIASANRYKILHTHLIKNILLFTLSISCNLFHSARNNTSTLILFFNNNQKMVVICRSRLRPDSLHGYKAHSLWTDLLTYLLTEWFIELHFAAKTMYNV